MKFPFLISLVFCVGCARTCDEQQLDCMKRMQFIVDMLYIYASDMGGFPCDDRTNMYGDKLCSWRLSVPAQVLGILDAPAMNTMWPSEEYLEENLSVEIGTAYQSRDLATIGNHTDILAVTGPGTTFFEFGEGRDRDLQEIEPDAILLVECKSDIHWIEPRDIDVRSVLNSTKNTGLGFLEGNYPNGFLIAFADGAVWFVKNTVPSTDLNKFLTIESARKYDREDYLGGYVIKKLDPNEDLLPVKKWQEMGMRSDVPNEPPIPEERSN